MEAALQPQGNEAIIDALLDDLSTTDDSTEAAQKAKLLRQLVSGIPVTPEKVEIAAKRIAGTPAHARLQLDIATVARFHKAALSPYWSLCSAVMVVAGLVWLYANGAPSVGAKILWVAGAVLSLLNVASFVTNYRFWRFARDIRQTEARPPDVADTSPDDQ